MSHANPLVLRILTFPLSDILKNLYNCFVALIKIDRDMWLEDLYHLRSLLPLEADEARTYLQKLVELVHTAPLDSKQANYPRMGIRRD